MMAVKSEISKYEDTLKEYQLYKRFLEALTPKVGLVYGFIPFVKRVPQFTGILLLHKEHKVVILSLWTFL